MAVRVEAPCRFDLAGSWTDVPEISERLGPEGGKTLNAAICLLDERGQPDPVWGLLDFGSEDLGGNGPGGEWHSPHNVGGLGTSASMNVVICAMASYRGHRGNLDDHWRARIAHNAFLMGTDFWDVLGGKQDERAAVYGGIKLYHFHPDGSVTCEIVTPPAEAIEALERQLILFDTGKDRLSGDIHREVWGGGNLERNVPVMQQLVVLAEQMAGTLKAGDLVELGGQLRENCELLFSLHESVGDPRIRQALDVLDERKLLLGGKPGGAGGGGVLGALVKEGTEVQAVEILSSLGFGRVLPWKFDFEGLRFREEGREG